MDKERNRDELTKNLIDIVRHMAQRYKEPPAFIAFEERAHHDLDSVVQQYINNDLGPQKIQQSLLVEYGRIVTGRQFTRILRYLSQCVTS